MKFLWLRVQIAQPVSHPARGAWIEIHLWRLQCVAIQVAPRKGCVD